MRGVVDVPSPRKKKKQAQGVSVRMSDEQMVQLERAQTLLAWQWRKRGEKDHATQTDVLHAALKMLLDALEAEVEKAKAQGAEGDQPADAGVFP